MITFGLLDAPVGIAMELAKEVFYGLNSVTAAASPVISSLYNILLYTCSMDSDNTCFAGLIIKALYQDQLFFLLNEGSYFEFSKLLASGYFLEMFISLRTSPDVTAP